MSSAEYSALYFFYRLELFSLETVLFCLILGCKNPEQCIAAKVHCFWVPLLRTWMWMLSLLAVFVDKFLLVVRFLQLYLSNLETFVALTLPTDQIWSDNFFLTSLVTLAIPGILVLKLSMRVSE